MPGMTSDPGRTATELVDDAVESGGFIARLRMRELACDYAAALATSDHPDAAAWAAALAWFAKRTRGGQIELHMHREFVERFGVDLAETDTTETHMRHTTGHDPARAGCDASITTGLVTDPADVTCRTCQIQTSQLLADQANFQAELMAGEDY